MFYMKFNGLGLPSYCYLATIPQITNSDVKRNRYNVPMHDGDMLDHKFYHGSAYVTITVHTTHWNERKGSLKAYFASTSGGTGYAGHEMKLRFYEGTEPQSYTYYKVKAVKLVGEEMKHGNYGRLTYEFEIEPIEYVDESNISFSGGASTTLLNSYSAIAKPVIRLGQGVFGTLQLTGKTGVSIAAFESTYLIIDTKNKVILDDENNLCEGYMAGDYEDLWIPVGGTTMTTSANMSGTLTPNRGNIV